MISWYKRKYIFLIVICLAFGSQNSLLATQKRELGFRQNSQRRVEQLPSQALIAKSVNCQAINSSYQEVYTFSTDLYNISICQSGTNYYYYRQSKTDVSNALLIPAMSAFGDDVFQANNNGTTYFIGRNGDRYYSSVMRNNSEIVFEPESEPEEVAVKTTNIASDRVTNTSVSESTPKSVNVDLKLDSSQLDNPQNISSRSLVCADRNSAHPHLDGWQKLVGKSTDSVNQYVVRQGHSFIYNGSKPQMAVIETNAGEVIDLNITAANGTVDRVCINPELKQ